MNRKAEKLMPKKSITPRAQTIKEQEEISSYVEEEDNLKPQMVFKYPCETIVYMYADINGNAWVECALTKNSQNVFSKRTLACL